MGDEAAVLAACATLVRDNDPDRYFSALFAPAALRPFLFVLYAFNSEIARIGDRVREPMLGEIRLQWWRETVEDARIGRPRATDIARGLALLFARFDVPYASFDEIIEARRFDVSHDLFEDLIGLETYLDATSGNVMRLAAHVLGAGKTMDDAVRLFGLAYGLTGIALALPSHLSRRRLYLPRALLATRGLSPESTGTDANWNALADLLRIVAERARSHWNDARHARPQKEVLPAILPAALVPLYLRRLARASFDPRSRLNEVPIHRRQLALLAARIRGRP